jgi:hypothetical protein
MALPSRMGAVISPLIIVPIFFRRTLDIFEPPFGMANVD